MVTRTLISLVFGLAALSGCGGGDDTEAKQAALAPATLAATPEGDIEEPPPAPAPTPAESAKPAAPVAAVALDSASPTNADSDGPTNADSDPPETPTLSISGRESFSYSGGSRDPFASLLNVRLGPELPDLTLVAIYYDTKTPNGSVVVMREKVGGRKYSLRPGDRLGRMRVSNVGPKDVTFTIDDFGTERQETVSLRKQEEAQ